jgi:hypothetical protein
MKRHPEMTVAIMMEGLRAAARSSDGSAQAHRLGGPPETPEEKEEARLALQRCLDKPDGDGVRTLCVGCGEDMPVDDTMAFCVCGGFVCEACQRVEDDDVCNHDNPHAMLDEDDEDDEEDIRIETVKQNAVKTMFTTTVDLLTTYFGRFPDACLHWMQTTMPQLMEPPKQLPKLDRVTFVRMVESGGKDLSQDELENLASACVVLSFAGMAILNRDHPGAADALIEEMHQKLANLMSKEKLH